MISFPTATSKTLFYLLLILMSSSAFLVAQPIALHPYATSGQHSSPDGLFAIQLPTEGKEQPIRIYRLRPKKSLFYSFDIWGTGIHGFCWLPNKKHAFVIASSTPKGKPYIAYWNGKEKLGFLVHGKQSIKKYYYEPDYVFVLDSIDLHKNILRYHESQSEVKGTILLPP